MYRGDLASALKKYRVLSKSDLSPHYSHVDYLHDAVVASKAAKVGGGGGR